MTAAASPDDLRADGWSVAVHNDYFIGAERHTFWLTTKVMPFPSEGNVLVALKGEGRTDAEALNQIRAKIEARNWR